MTTRLIDFYRGKGLDARGRTLSAIQHWGFDQLEYAHDYIQWLFPLRTASAFQPHSPVLTDADISMFHDSPDLREKLATSLDVMLRFYGFDRQDGSIVRSPDWPERSRNWLTPENHNHLRLTRILTSLSILGLRAQALALQAALLKEYDSAGSVISPTTRRFWANAVEPEAKSRRNEIESPLDT